MALGLHEPIHQSMLARRSGATGCTNILFASSLCLLMAIPSAHGIPAANIIGRPQFARGSSDGGIGAVTVRGRRTALGATLIRLGFVVGGRSVTNLD